MKITKYSKLIMLEGTSEIFYKSEGDTVWHVLKNYSSQSSNAAPVYNVSEHFSTSDSVAVKNNFVGIDRNDSQQ